MQERPVTVCICGSMRFMEEIRAASHELSSIGIVVLGPVEVDGGVSDQEKSALDARHLRRIAQADRVLVVNPGGYLGESTLREIAYARASGKPVSFTDPVRPEGAPGRPSERRAAEGS